MRFGGRETRIRNGYLLKMVSHKKANSEYRLLTGAPRCEEAECYLGQTTMFQTSVVI